jgi:uncharacterized surface anchored protein
MRQKNKKKFAGLYAGKRFLSITSIIIIVLTALLMEITISVYAKEFEKDQMVRTAENWNFEIGNAGRTKRNEKGEGKERRKVIDGEKVKGQEIKEKKFIKESEVIYREEELLGGEIQVPKEVHGFVNRTGVDMTFEELHTMKVLTRATGISVDILTLTSTALPYYIESYIPRATADLPAGSYMHHTLERFQLDGEDVFCVHEGAWTQAGWIYGGSDEELVLGGEVLSEEMIKKMALIGHYGFEIQGKGDWDYAVTQGMIWEEMGSTFISNTIDGYLDRKVHINTLLNHHTSLPSYHGETLEQQAGANCEIEDTNSITDIFTEYTATLNGAAVDVSSIFQRIDSSNADMLRLSIREDIEGEVELFLIDPLGKSIVTSNLFYQAVSSSKGQAMGRLGYVDTKEASLKLHITPIPTLGEVRVKKTDSATGNRLSGAVFKLYEWNKSEDAYKDYGILNWNGESQEYELEQLPITADNKGWYKVEESVPPQGYVQENKKPWEMSFQITDENSSFLYEAVNSAAKGRVVIQKKGELVSGFSPETGEFQFTNQGLPGAEFTIYAGQEILSADGRTKLFEKDDPVKNGRTDTNGILIFEDLPLGEFYIEEIKAPDGYILEPQRTSFTLKYKDSITPVIEYKGSFTNKLILGTVKIVKMGDAVSSYDSDTQEFEYSLKGLQGAEFHVMNKDDILNFGGEVLVKSRTILKTLITDEEGKAALGKADLPMGTYIIKEVKAPEGYLLQEGEEEFTLEDTNENSPVIEYVTNHHNQRQSAQIKIVKKDKSTKRAVEGAVFGLYTKSVVQIDGKELVPKDTLLETVTTDEKGEATFKSGERMPFGLYYVKEIEAPKGYLVSNKVYEVDFQPAGQSLKALLFEEEFENDFTKVLFNKADILTGESIAGAKMYLTEKGKTQKIREWVSGEKPVQLDYLPAGEYTLHEAEAPQGYEIAQPIDFVVKQNSQIQGPIVMYDDFYGYIEILKTSSGGEKLSGAEFGLYKEEGTLVCKFTTDEEGYAISEQILRGTYYLQEVKSPKGYILDKTRHEIKIDCANKIVRLELENQPEKIEEDTKSTEEIKTKKKESPRTEDTSHIAVLGIFIVSILVLVYVRFRFKKR